MRFAVPQIALLGLAVMLAGCAGTPATGPQATAQAPISDLPAVPPDYRKTAAQFLRRSLKDPDSVRSPQISRPAPGFVGLLNGGNAMVVCVRLNARNSFGGYTGLSDTALVFRGGQIAGFIDDRPLACQGRLYEPFPEMLPGGPKTAS